MHGVHHTSFGSVREINQYLFHDLVDMDRLSGFRYDCTQQVPNGPKEDMIPANQSIGVSVPEVANLGTIFQGQFDLPS